MEEGKDQSRRMLQKGRGLRDHQGKTIQNPKEGGGDAQTNVRLWKNLTCAKVPWAMTLMGI